MQKPLEITFRNMEWSEAVASAVERKLAKLEQLTHAIIRCHVTIGLPHQHHVKGKRYEVNIDLTIPHYGLIIGKSHDNKREYEDVYVAIRDAFEAIRRQVEAHNSRRRSKVKTSEKICEHLETPETT